MKEWVRDRWVTRSASVGQLSSSGDALLGMPARTGLRVATHAPIEAVYCNERKTREDEKGSDRLTFPLLCVRWRCSARAVVLANEQKWFQVEVPMRTIFVLFLMSGCAAATPEIVYIERPARVQAAPTRTSEPTDADPHGLSITYQGDAEHRLIRLQSLSPGVTRIEGVSDRSTWPMVSVRYRVLPGTRTVYFQATSSFPGLQETVACRRHFSTLTVWYGGEPVGTSERLANAGCLLEIILPLRTSFPPPTTSNGRGMWGTRSGPPVPALDDTLP